MAKPLTAAKNLSQQNLNNSNTSQLSVRMTVNFLKEHLDDEFVALFSHTEEMAQHLADSFLENGFDESQPVHLAYIEDEDKEVVIDGMTRLHALELANFFDVPVFKHIFKTRLDALMHAYRLQLDRRNLNDAQKIAAVEKMLLLKNPNQDGKTAAAIASQLGMSTRNVEKAINIIKNGDEETKRAVLNAEMSINAGDKETHAKKKTKERLFNTPGGEPIPLDFGDDISDALEDTSGDPKGLAISDHSDHIERPTNRLSPEEDSERTRERRKAYEMGLADGRKENLESLTGSILIKHFGTKIPAKSVRYDATSQKLIIEADEKAQRLILRGDQAEDFIVNEEITVERLIRELSKLAPKSIVKINGMDKAAVNLCYYPDQHITVISDHGVEMDRPFHGDSPADDGGIDIDGIEFGEDK